MRSDSVTANDFDRNGADNKKLLDNVFFEYSERYRTYLCIRLPLVVYKIAIKILCKFCYKKVNCEPLTKGTDILVSGYSPRADVVKILDDLLANDRPYSRIELTSKLVRLDPDCESLALRLISTGRLTSLNQFFYLVKALGQYYSIKAYKRSVRRIYVSDTFNYPGVLFVKAMFGKKLRLIGLQHGVKLKIPQDKIRYPIEAGCDEVYFWHKSASEIYSKQFEIHCLKKPELVFRPRKIDGRIVEEVETRSICYLPTVYRKLYSQNLIIELIEFNERFKELPRSVSLHPSLRSNWAKRQFYQLLCYSIGLSVSYELRDDVLFISNGSTAIVELQTKGYAVAYWRPRSASHFLPDDIYPEEFNIGVLT